MHEWATRGAERRNTAAYGHAISLGAFRTVLGVGVWMRRARFPGARALGGSSTWRLGGLPGRQLTGPVAEAPEVDLRSSAASRHQAELGVWCPGGAEAKSAVPPTGNFRKKSYSRKTRPRPGVSSGCEPRARGAWTAIPPAVRKQCGSSAEAVRKQCGKAAEAVRR